MASSSDPDDSVVADLNNDGIPDVASLVSSVSGNGSVLMMINDGQGSFSRDANIVPTGDFPTQLVVADFDGVDGNDLAVTSRSSDGVTMRRNAPTSPFSTSQTVLSPSRLAGGDRPHNSNS